MASQDIQLIDAGLMGYGEALELQRSLVEARIAGERGGCLVFVEHPPVVTMGRAASEANLVVSREALSARGVEVFEVERGGDVTYHAPGQLVGYPIIDLKARGLTVHGYLRLIESSLIEALGSFGISAAVRKGLTGVWTSQGKVAAIGIAARRWITFHGFALNVNTDLSGFDSIVPCGLSGERVTSMERLLGRTVDMRKVRHEAAAALGRAFGCDIISAVETSPMEKGAHG